MALSRRFVIESLPMGFECRTERGLDPVHPVTDAIGGVDRARAETLGPWSLVAPRDALARPRASCGGCAAAANALDIAREGGDKT